MENLINENEFDVRNIKNVADVIYFAAYNNQYDVIRRLQAKGFNVKGLTTPDSVYRYVLNIYNSGFAVGELINVPYRNNVPNFTGGLQDSAKGITASKGFADTFLGQVLVGLLPVAAGLIVTNLMGNVDNAPGPDPTNVNASIEPTFIEKYGTKLFWGGIAAGVFSVLLTAYGYAKKRKALYFTSGAFSVMFIIAVIYIYMNTKKGGANA